MKYTTFKALRIRKRISQIELSEQSGVNIRTIQSLECGARSTHRMTLENAYRLAMILGIQVDAFLEKDEIRFPDGKNGDEFEEDVKARKIAEKAERDKARKLRQQKQASISDN